MEGSSAGNPRPAESFVVRTERGNDDAPPKESAKGSQLGYVFDPLPRELREQAGRGELKTIDLAVMAVLLHYRRRICDSCWCTKRTIGKAVGRCARTVQSSLSRLEKAGWIRQVEVDNPDPDEPANRTGYRIVFPWLRKGGPELGPGPDRRKPQDRRAAKDDPGQNFLSFEPSDGHPPKQFISSPPQQQIASPPREEISSKELLDGIQSESEEKQDVENVERCNAIDSHNPEKQDPDSTGEGDPQPAEPVALGATLAEEVSQSRSEELSPAASVAPAAAKAAPPGETFADLVAEAEATASRLTAEDKAAWEQRAREPGPLGDSARKILACIRKPVQCTAQEACKLCDALENQGFRFIVEDVNRRDAEKVRVIRRPGATLDSFQCEAIPQLQTLLLAEICRRAYYEQKQRPPENAQPVEVPPRGFAPGKPLRGQNPLAAPRVHSPKRIRHLMSMLGPGKEDVAGELADALVIEFREQDAETSRATFYGLALDVCNGRLGPSCLLDPFDQACSLSARKRGAVFIAGVRREIHRMRKRRDGRRATLTREEPAS